MRGSLVGRVVSVTGSRVLVRIAQDIAGLEPIWDGKLHSVGQVGTLMKLPQGGSRLIAIVSSLAVVAASDALADQDSLADARQISLELVGEIDGAGVFNRGVSQWPGIDDPVHFVLTEDMATLFPESSASHLALGRVSSNLSVTATADIGKLVSRHSAIVGSTGSGKSSAVASILQSVAKGPWPSASVVLFDAHGEYSSALGGDAKVVDLAMSQEPVLPYWVLPATEILEIYCPNGVTPLYRELFTERVVEARRSFAGGASWITMPSIEIGADTPVPFDLRDVWFWLDTANRETFSDSAKTMHALNAPGDAATLASNEFQPHTPNNSVPYKGSNTGKLGTLPEQLRQRLLDPDFAFLREGDLASATSADPLPTIVSRLLPITERISVIDTSLVPSRVAQQVVAAILGLLFELAKRRTRDGLGRDNPILTVVDEAHRYFGVEAARARTNLERISREGRKYGVGLMLVTQRPSELPATALSQVGTVIVLRLNNQADQSIVAATMPDGLKNLVEVLPSLRNGEAIVAGEAIALPSRIQIRPPAPWPAGDDPTISAWNKSPKRVDLIQNIFEWRERD